MKYLDKIKDISLRGKNEKKIAESKIKDTKQYKIIHNFVQIKKNFIYKVME